MNNISGKQHEQKIRDAMSRYSDVEILGMIRRDPSRTVGETKKGLVGPENENLCKMKEMAEDLDIDRIVDAMYDVPDMPSAPLFRRRPSQGIRAAVAMDDSFCFHYHDNIECMKCSGIEVVTFKPTEGEPLPPADIYYLGGGYQEAYAERLSLNGDFLEGIKNASEEGKVVLGECGGTAALCEEMIVSGKRYRMAGIFDAEAEMSGSRHGPSYVTGCGTPANPFFGGIPIRAHEFHYSELRINRPYGLGYELSRGTGISGGKDGLVVKKTLCTMMYQHALSVDDWSGRILLAVD